MPDGRSKLGARRSVYALFNKILSLLAVSTGIDLKRFYTFYYLMVTLLLILTQKAGAQNVTVRGTVYDSSRNYVIELVSVMSSSGKGTSTDAEGKYELELSPKDSIWFSYLNKPTQKFPVAKMQNPLAFDISLHINVTTLKEVKIRPRNYRQDSLQNREDYAKIFNYKRPGLKVNPAQTQYGAAVGFDLNEIINVFRFRKNRSTLAFQRRLITQEQDNFVDHRFNKAVVRRLTGLTEPELDTFMLLYRPSYYLATVLSDYDFQYYIKAAYERYRKGLPPMAFRPEDYLNPEDY